MDGADRPDLDAGRAIQQMELVAWAEGLGTCFVGLRDEKQNADVKSLLGIPADFQLITVLPFGYRQRATAGAQGRKNRKPVSEVAHRERFGQPYA
jgi:nitroreductase